MANFCQSDKSAQIIVSLHTKIETLIGGRSKMNLSTVKCIVIDEADVFFLDEKNFKTIKAIANYKDIKSRKEEDIVQWILFSATFPDGSEPQQELVH